MSVEELVFASRETHPIDETVIGIGTLVRALDSLPSRVLCNSQSQSVLITELFQFGNRAASERRDTFRV